MREDTCMHIIRVIHTLPQVRSIEKSKSSQGGHKMVPMNEYAKLNTKYQPKKY